MADTARESNKQVSNETILEQLNWRYAVKKFDAAKKVSDADWNTLEQSLILAPSSYGLQPYKFIVVTDENLKKELTPAAYGQTQIADCSHLVVIAYKKVLTDADVEHFVDRIVEVRGTPREQLADYENTMKGAAKQMVEDGKIETWNSRQAYIALGFLLETAALLGIDACPMEGFHPAEFDRILGLTDYSAVVLCPLGYRDAANDYMANQAKVRFPKEELIERR
ncbi:MAG TPA: NAD(P)H-dependent oxidoreductase [Pyrinomonadaceae bacterium]|nr:NAD(P)H-dependent oxidoreductase [Pyrinomonadaceae bacterium]